MASPTRTTSSYGPGVTGASKAVLLELMTVLRAYRDALILVGGWVPYFLLEQHRRADDPFVHVGSIDIDLAVDPDTVDEPHYATIVELLTARGYRPAADRPRHRATAFGHGPAWPDRARGRDVAPRGTSGHGAMDSASGAPRGGPLPQSFERTVQAPLTDKPYTIRVDFLAPHGATETHHALHLLIQDAFLARKTKGCAAAFRYATSFHLTGTLPNGGQLTVPIRMADVVASLTMKGIVLGERYREKDAYDIYALVAHYQQGPRDVAEALRPHLQDPLVSEGMAGIRAAFATRQAHGPAWAAAFLVQPLFAAERERVITDAFMTVHEFTTLLFEPEANPVPRLDPVPTRWNGTRLNRRGFHRGTG